MSEGAFMHLNQVPGPGHYPIQNSMQKYKQNKGVTMAQRYEDSKKLPVPGPGTYKRKGLVDNARPMSVPKGVRDNPLVTKELLTNPPPGGYKFKTQYGNHKKGVIISEKIPLSEQGDKKTNPGPGQYKPKDNRPQTGASFGKQRRDGEPGPVKVEGAIDNKLAEARQKRMESTGKLKGNAEGTGSGPASVPGPGAYVKKSDKSAPAYSMAGKSPIEDTKEVPGPGSYNNAKFVQKSKASILIGSGPKLAKDFTTQKLVPGPGTYKVVIKATNIGAAIGNSPRLAKSQSESMKVPGPGQYSIKTPKANVGAVIGDAVRFKYEKSQVPGPGAYKMPSSFGFQDQ